MNEKQVILLVTDSKGNVIEVPAVWRSLLKVYTK